MERTAVASQKSREDESTVVEAKPTQQQEEEDLIPGEVFVRRIPRGPKGVGMKLEERNDGTVYVTSTVKGSTSEQVSLTRLREFVLARGPWLSYCVAARNHLASIYM